MQPWKTWVGTAVLLIIYGNCLWAQSDQICFTCALKKTSQETKAKAAPPAKSKPETVKPAKAEHTTTLAKAGPARASEEHADPGPNAAEVKALRDLVAAQQEQLEMQHRQLDQLKGQMQQVLDAVQQANASAQKGASTAEQAQQSATEAQHAAEKASAKVDEVKTTLSTAAKPQDIDKKLSTLQELANRFRFNGDLRMREDSIFQDCVGCLDRNRLRLRARFGVEGKLGEDFIGGAALATGTLGDPTTTNETFTNFFDRKTIALDKGYITYQPHAFKWGQATVGKFAYTWNRTQVTGDPDINPEGASEKFSWDPNMRYVKNLNVSLMQLLFNEVTAGTDSYVLGWQAAGKVQIGRLTTTPSFMMMKWNNPDALLQASAFATGFAGTTANPAPGEGPGCSKGTGLPTVPPCAFAANTMTNATYTDAAGKPHFYSQWFYADLILNNQIKTMWPRFPVNVLLEYEDNLDAKDHPLSPTGNGVELTNLGKQSHAYQADVSIGQLKNKNDMQFGYLWLRQEQDAVLASFADSDQRAATNILQSKLYASWKMRPNTVANYVYWYGRTLDSSLQHAVLAPGTTAGETEPHVKRMFFELVYTF